MSFTFRLHFMQSRGWDTFYIKGVYLRFVLWQLRIQQIQPSSKARQQVDVLGMCLYTSIMHLITCLYAINA